MTTNHDEFVDYILELLQPLGLVSARRMFGGHGIFIDGLMFALITGQMLYLKADSINKIIFEQAGLERFSYYRAGKLTYLAYYQAPSEALEDGEIMMEWARRSVSAAIRNAAD